MSLCTHFQPGCYPFSVLLVLDDHLGFTEALVRCDACERTYLLEMLDWLGTLRLFRVGEPDTEAARLLLKDLQRGSCDLTRASEEVRQFGLITERLPVVLLIDTAARAIAARWISTESGGVSGQGWRELPCDGSHILGNR